MVFFSDAAGGGGTWSPEAPSFPGRSCGLGAAEDDAPPAEPDSLTDEQAPSARTSVTSGSALIFLR